jgi:hypothetical protein
MTGSASGATNVVTGANTYSDVFYGNIHCPYSQSGAPADAFINITPGMGSWGSSITNDASSATVHWEGWFDGCYDYLGPESNYGILDITIKSTKAASLPTVSKHGATFSNQGIATGNFCILQGNYYVHSCYNTPLTGDNGSTSLSSQTSTGL